MILPVTTSPKVYKSRLLPLFRRLINKSGCDVYVPSPKPSVEFKALKLKIFEKLYDTEFTFSGKDYGEYAYPTFIFDKFRRKPIEVVVKPEIIDRINEEYFIYKPHEPNILLGERMFNVIADDPAINSGDMRSYHRLRYAASGIREHQIAIERMLMEGKENVKICSVPGAYLFHKNCGFVPVNKYMKLSFTEFDWVVGCYLKDYQKSMKLSADKIKKMIVYKVEGEHVLFDNNLTFANFMEYAYAHKYRYSQLPEFLIDMELTPEALEEWKMIIEKQPILIGKEIPKTWPILEGK